MFLKFSFTVHEKFRENFGVLPPISPSPNRHVHEYFLVNTGIPIYESCKPVSVPGENDHAEQKKHLSSGSTGQM